MIAQVSAGSAPSGLQDAFAKLESDLQGGSGNPGGAGTPPTLQALLSKLQGDLG